MTDNASPSTSRRGGSWWWDLAAFVGGLALAWFGRWETRDLVWSLWLSSLLVGYGMIIWMIFSPGLLIALGVWKARRSGETDSMAKVAALGALYLAGALFLLAFFTVHFGMFHFVHSAFLNSFFPMNAGQKGMPSFALYRGVFLAYWPFVIVAAVAERQAFKWPAAAVEPGDTSVTAEAIARRKAKSALSAGGGNMMTPYKNVIRLHLLIFFFAFASFLHVGNFAIYAVVYAVYFFPWRMFSRAAKT